MKKIYFLSELIGFLLFVHIIYAQTPSVPTILGSSTQDICQGKSTYFSANCATGTPKWYNAIRTILLGSGETFFTPTISANTNYTVRCETNTTNSNFVLLTVNMTNATNISTDITLSESCFGTSGQNITLTANPTNVGTNAKYFWAKNDEPLGMFYTPPFAFDRISPTNDDGVNDIYVHTDNKVYISYPDRVEVEVTGAGSTKRVLGNIDINSGHGKMDVDKNLVLYVATALGLFKARPSDNNMVATSFTVRSNCVKVAKNGFIYVGTSEAGIAISKDGGNTFSYKTTADGLGSDFITDIFITDEGKIYVANPPVVSTNYIGSFSYSTDGGETFHSTSRKINNIASEFTTDIFVDGKGKVYVSTEHGLSISTDGGLTFTNRTTENGLGSNNISSVFVSKNGDIYAGCVPSPPNYTGGLSVSTNGGDSFVNYNSTNGLITPQITAVGVSSTSLGVNYIYAGTYNGLFATTRTNNTNVLPISNAQTGDEYHLSIEPTAGICPVPSFASKRIRIGNSPAVAENLTTQNVCVGSSVNLTATCLEGTPVWYDSRTSNVSLGSGSPFAVSPTTNKVYYPTCYINSFCESVRNAGIRPYSGTLAVNAPKFFRPKSFTETIEDIKNNVRPVEYQTHSLAISREGEHIFSLLNNEGGSVSKAGANTFLCLYNSNGFDPNSPLTNLIAFETSEISIDLAVGNYTLVMSRADQPTFIDLTPLPWNYQINQRSVVQSPLVKVFVQPIPTVPSVTTNTVTVCSGSSALLVANCASSGGTKNTPVWYNQTDIFYSNPVFSGSNFNISYIDVNRNYQVRCESATCASTGVATSIIVSTVSNIPNFVANQEICAGTNITFSSACGGSTNVVWYNANGNVKLFTGNNFTPTDLTNSAVFNYVCENNLGCRGTFRTVNLTVKGGSPTGITSSYTVFKGSVLSLEAVCSVGDSIEWFGDQDDLLIRLYEGSPFITPILNNSFTYKVACKNKDCGRSDFQFIYITVTDPTPSSPIAQANASIPWGSSITLTANGCSGSTGVFALKWYSASDNLGVTMPISPRTISNYYAKCQLVVDNKTYLSNKSSNVETTFNDLIISVLSGNWENESTWNLNRIPMKTDHVMIDKNHVILLHSSPEIKNLIFNGTGQLKYNSVGANLKSGLFR